MFAQPYYTYNVDNAHDENYDHIDDIISENP